MMGRAFAAVFRRELRLAWRRRGQLLQPLVFYALVMLLFPLGAGADLALLGQAAPSLLWVAALLAVLLAQGTLFSADLEEGGIELWVTSGVSLGWLALAKLIAHAMIVSLPLILVGPVLAGWLGLRGEALWVLAASMALGMPVLCWIGALGTALTLGLPRGGILLALIVLPLYIPVLMFGAGAVHAAVEGRPADGALLLLAGLLFLGVSLAPPATAAALRVSQE